ncbi:hydroxymethylglutaryl-CoA lyase [Bradyrhizobium sp. 160]|uniref:hydroxymethylglutaryl-CoA lyase n=1 Tax=Bradyrhizobium sp. 160 TaxID=2782634 RepID=UPI001FFA6D07|nr:hydroxymethylglutaryl-CoA lyase [Bradyrhizobium sp. 160]MCK1622505.1 hydroxymethylglutaryl-CoA lyase [Bradyrhizobium sp. 160]
MSNFPTSVEIVEEGPREGFQIEPGPISTAAKIELIDALSQTGVKTIQVASFVNPKAVPGWADAEAVVRGFTPSPGVAYTALWFNERGMERALSHRDRLVNAAAIALSASEAFSLQNLRRDRQGQIEAMRSTVAAHLAANVPVDRVIVMAAFGCNFSGEVPLSAVISTIKDGLGIAEETWTRICAIGLGDSMGWCTPRRIQETVTAIRERWPELELSLHLHDTRGLGIASAYEGLRLGVSKFDAAVAGLGGCPFAGQPGAPGNIATEELVLLCEQLGIPTGINLDRLIDVARLAEQIVGHRLPSALLRSGRPKMIGTQ